MKTKQNRKKCISYAWHFVSLPPSPFESQPYPTGGALAAIKSSFIQITIAKLNAVICVAIVVYSLGPSISATHQIHAVSFHLNRGQKAYEYI